MHSRNLGYVLRLFRLMPLQQGSVYKLDNRLDSGHGSASVPVYSLSIGHVVRSSASLVSLSPA